MWNVRKLIKLKDRKLDLNENGINIFEYPKKTIPHWEPELSLSDFDSVSCLYLDIETYSSNEICLDYFSYVLRYGKKLKNSKRYTDKPLVDFLLKHIDDEIVKDHLLWRFDPIKHDGFIMSDSEIYNNLLADIALSLKPLAKDLPLIDDKGALDPDKGIIVLIGLINEKGKTFVIDCISKGEDVGIETFYHILEKVQPTFLAHFNGFDFDLPFIERRAKIYGLNSPFWVSDSPTIFRSAQRFGEPAQYNAFWYNYGKVAIVDLYHQSLAWDFVNRKLTEFSLKKVVLALGLRKDERLVLSFEEMCKCVESGDLTKLKEYLVYDLEDSLLIGNFLLPDIYYQREILDDWNFQSISTGGFGTKWDDKLVKEYQKIDPYKDPPIADMPVSFEGGLVGGKAGLYRNVSKIDVASLYPTIMLLYHVYSCKDTEMILLRILQYLLTKRLAFKAIAAAKKGTKEGSLAKQRQGALKVMINSAYGALGVTNKGFNDYLSAATVTGYGRAILRAMIKALEEFGVKVASYDTDGVYFASESLEKNKKAWEYCQSKMPGSGQIKVNLEYELEALAFYVPPISDEKKRGEKGDEGLRKNYIIINRDGTVKANGKFRKRDKSILEKTFTPDLVKHFLEGTHKAFYKDIINQMLAKTYPVENLAATRKIKANEKRLVELGIGLPGQVVTIYKGVDEVMYSAKTGKALKKVNVVWTTNPDEIDWQFYLSMVNDMYAEFMTTPKM